MRIMAANKSFGALSSFFSLQEINTRSKYLIFMAIQSNLLLWGCESWALRKDLLEKLERFVNRKIRSILSLNMTNVKEEKSQTNNYAKDSTTFQVCKL